jgi:hypothetical protein
LLSSSIAQDRSLRTIDPLNGHMTVEQAVISKACVSPYKGREIPKWQELGLDPEKVYQLLRAPEEMARAADSFSNLPLMIRHVPIHASKHPNELVVGTTGTVTYEHPYLISRPLKVWTQPAIDVVCDERQRELSCGYGYTADMSAGTYEGIHHDGIMRGLGGNHLALVTEGRVGPEAIVPDELPEDLKPMKHAALIEKLKPHLAAGVDLVALDTIFEVGNTSTFDEEMEAIDEANECYGKTADEWKDMKAEDKKMARDKWAKDKKVAKDKAATDKAAADKKAADAGAHKGDDFESAKDGITQDQLDSSIAAAVKLAREQSHAAAVAREAVKPIVGVIALDAAGMDSAEAIYGFALKHAGVKIDGVHPSAFAALLEVVKTRKAPPVPIALDASVLQHNVSSIFRKRA